MFLGLIVFSRMLNYHYYDDGNSWLSVYSWSFYGLLFRPSYTLNYFCLSPSRVFSHPFSAFIFSECTLSVLRLFVHNRLHLPDSSSQTFFAYVLMQWWLPVKWSSLNTPRFSFWLSSPLDATWTSNKNSSCKSFCAGPRTLLYSVSSHFYLISTASDLKAIPFFWHAISILCINTASNNFI